MDNLTIENIQERIVKLPFYHQLTFFYFLSKRQLPNYLIFSQKENWGNPNLLKEAISLLEKIIVTQNDFDKETSEMIKKLEKVTPDTDDFAGFLTSLALDACATLLEGLAFYQDKDSNHIQDICNSSLDLAQMYIEFRDNADFDDYCFNDQVIIDELNFQLNSLEKHENQSKIDEQFLDTIKIEESKIGELLTGINTNKTIDIPVELDEEIQTWIKQENVNLRELIPDLLKSFYQSLKKVQNKAAL